MFWLKEDGVSVRAYYEGEPSADERQSMSDVESQLYADLPEGFVITLEVVATDRNDPLLRDWFSAYLRKEE
jgi:hypothetical protein